MEYGVCGSYYNIPKAIFDLLKGDYKDTPKVMSSLRRMMHAPCDLIVIVSASVALIMLSPVSSLLCLPIVFADILLLLGFCSLEGKGGLSRPLAVC